MKYDLHIHTNYSRCSNLEPNVVLETAIKQGLNGIAITDHDTIKGALEIKKLNKNPSFEVIVGEEISTNIGHVLVYYLKKGIKSKNIKKVLLEVKKQNAICVLAHPYNILTGKITKILSYKNARKTINKKSKIIKSFDAIEGFNSRCILKKENILAQKLAKIYKKVIIAGSDAHFKSEIGNAYVEFDDKFNLRTSIKKNKIKIKINKRKGFFLNIYYRIKSVLLKLKKSK